MALSARRTASRKYTGDDRGGIAVSSTHVFYTGDEQTGAYALSDLSGGVDPGQRYDALTSNLRTGSMYSLGDGALPITSSGGTVTTLLEIDGATGALTGVSIPLSTLIPATYPTGIFAGYDRVVLYTNDTVYDVALPSGVVTNLGSICPRRRSRLARAGPGGAWPSTSAARCTWSTARAPARSSSEPGYPTA